MNRYILQAKVKNKRVGKHIQGFLKLLIIVAYFVSSDMSLTKLIHKAKSKSNE